MTRSRLAIAAITAMAASILAARAASAAVLCAATSTQLQSMLDFAETNGEDDTIRIAAGTYTYFTPPQDGFVYNAVTPAGGDDRDITLIGGWSELLGNPCGQLLSEDPFLTVIDGQGSHRALHLRVRPNSNVSVRLLTFLDGDAGGGGGGGLLIGSGSTGTHTGAVRVESNVFLLNRANVGAGLRAYESSGILRVINNLFVANHAALNNGAALLSREAGGSGIFVISNTVTGNSTDHTGTSATGGLHIEGPVTRQIGNNNLWDNDGADLFVTNATGTFTLFNNNIGIRIGTDPTSSMNNISIEPQYQPGLFNYTPVRSSPLVDAGAHPGMFSFWFLTDLDLKSEDRTVATVDIGAYENERLFGNGFQTTGPFAIDDQNSD